MQQKMLDEIPLVLQVGGRYFAPAWCGKCDVVLTVGKFAGANAAQSLVAAGTVLRPLRSFLRYLFIQPEDVNGVRMSWNTWPRTRQDMERMGVPLGCLYSPFALTQNLNQATYDPVKCPCSGVLNPFCSVDLQEKTWVCPFCSTRNAFPARYAEQISEACLPWEMKPQFSTMEYITGHMDTPPIFLMMLDVASFDDELEDAKDVLQHVCTMLPGNALIGLITFGANCLVHDMRELEMGVARSHAFKGNRSYSCEEVSRQLSLHEVGCQHSFILPVAECYHTSMCAVGNTIGDSARGPTPQRPWRCTGAALSVAISLLGASFPGCGARVVLITGGPCTLGPGMVASESFHEPIRSYLDMKNNTERARYMQAASSFYDALATQASSCGFSVDICAASLDDVGLHEMRVLVDKTGGSVIMADSFSTVMFKDTFRGLFKARDTGELCMGLNADISVITSEEFQCSGAIGALTHDNVPGPAVSKHGIGEGAEYHWKLGCLGENTTIGFYFDIVGHNVQKRHGFLQLQTRYMHPSGQRRLRVTTVSHAYADLDTQKTLTGFDSEAAAILVFRHAVNLADNVEVDIVENWLDSKIVRVMETFAACRERDVDLLSVDSRVASFVQMVYHSQRSWLLHGAHYSLDESAYRSAVLLREKASHACRIIQPTLIRYSYLRSTPDAVPLEMSSIEEDAIFIFDTYFGIACHHGDAIRQWCELGYQHKDEYQFFGDWVAAAGKTVEQLTRGRLVRPRLHLYRSAERSLRCAINPSLLHYSQPRHVSFKAFMEDLLSKFVQDV